MKQGDLFNLPEANRLKEEGIELVSSHNEEWKARALRIARDQLPHGEVMGEDFQKLPDIGRPESSHAWGALVQDAKRAGIIRSTGKIRKSTLISNHAHKYEIYWREGFPK